MDRPAASPSSPRARFRYVIYIQAAAEAVWKGLTEPEATRRYWQHENISDWRPGSPWEHRRTNEESTDDDGTVDIVGEVVENAFPHRLVITWAFPHEAADPAKVSRVTFMLDEEWEGDDFWPGGPWTRLRIAHTDLEPGGEMLHGIRDGWPMVASGLKTLLETGRFGS